MCDALSDMTCVLGSPVLYIPVRVSVADCVWVWVRACKLIHHVGLLCLLPLQVSHFLADTSCTLLPLLFSAMALPTLPVDCIGLDGSLLATPASALHPCAPGFRRTPTKHRAYMFWCARRRSRWLEFRRVTAPRLSVLYENRFGCHLSSACSFDVCDDLATSLLECGSPVELYASAAHVSLMPVDYHEASTMQVDSPMASTGSMWIRGLLRGSPGVCYDLTPSASVDLASTVSSSSRSSIDTDPSGEDEVEVDWVEDLWHALFLEDLTLDTCPCV